MIPLEQEVRLYYTSMGRFIGKEEVNKNSSKKDFHEIIDPCEIFEMPAGGGVSYAFNPMATIMEGTSFTLRDRDCILILKAGKGFVEKYVANLQVLVNAGMPCEQTKLILPT